MKLVNAEALKAKLYADLNDYRELYHSQEPKSRAASRTYGKITVLVSTINMIDELAIEIPEVNNDVTDADYPQLAEL